MGPQRRRAACRWRPFSNHCNILDNGSFSVQKPVLESPDPLLSNAVARSELNPLHIDLEGKTYIESLLASSSTLGGRHQVVARRPASKISIKSLRTFFFRNYRRNRFLWTLLKAQIPPQDSDEKFRLMNFILEDLCLSLRLRLSEEGDVDARSSSAVDEEGCLQGSLALSCWRLRSR